MSLQKIKSFITIRNIDQISRFDSVADEQIVNAYQCTEEMAGAVERLIGWAESGRAAIISGERGVGKSHLLAFVRSLIGRPDLTSHIEHPTARARLQRAFAHIRSQPSTVAVYCDSEQASPDAQVAIKSADALIAGAGTRGYPIAVFIDSISSLLRTPNRDAYLKWLSRLIGDVEPSRQWLFLAVDQDLLSLLAPDSSRWEAEIIPLENLAKIVDQFICQKSRPQRRTIEELYDRLLRQMPHFQSSMSEFTEFYPIHPQVLKLAPALRTYARTFSLFGFLNGVAPRALLRRELNLICLIELFETFEFDLRRNPLLADLFAAYDHLNGNFVRSLPAGQQLYGKMMLRALTMLSLSERSYTTLEIADSVMLFDENPQVLFRQSLKTVMNFMATVAGDRIEVINENGETRFRFRLFTEPKGADLLAEAPKQVSNDDSRIIEALKEPEVGDLQTDLPSEPVLAQPLETVFQDLVTEALSSSPPPVESSAEGDVLLEFYQSGEFRPFGELKLAANLVSAANPAPNEEPSFDEIDVEPFTGSFKALELPPEEPETNVRAQVPDQSKVISPRTSPRLILARKLTNERAANKELLLLYEKFIDACGKYKYSKPIPPLEEFKLLILKQAKAIREKSHCREVWCQLEVAGGTVQVHCQAGRASLFQKRQPKCRVL